MKAVCHRKTKKDENYSSRERIYFIDEKALSEVELKKAVYMNTLKGRSRKISSKSVEEKQYLEELREQSGYVAYVVAGVISSSGWALL